MRRHIHLETSDDEEISKLSYEQNRAICYFFSAFLDFENERKKKRVQLDRESFLLSQEERSANTRKLNTLFAFFSVQNLMRLHEIRIEFGKLSPSFASASPAAGFIGNSSKKSLFSNYQRLEKNVCDDDWWRLSLSPLDSSSASSWSAAASWTGLFFLLDHHRATTTTSTARRKRKKSRNQQLN